MAEKLTWIEKFKNIAALMAEIISPVKLSFAAKFEDGTPVMFEPALEVGAVVMLTTDEGTLPVADGQYTLEGGSSVTVFEGKVSVINEAPTGDDTPATEDLAKVLEAKLAIQLGAQFTTVSKVAELEVKLAAQDALIQKQTTIMSEMFEAMQDFASASPTRDISQPTAPKKAGFDPNRVAAALAEVKKEKATMRDALENMINSKPK